jgi:hypothetical protein
MEREKQEVQEEAESKANMLTVARHPMGHDDGGHQMRRPCHKPDSVLIKIQQFCSHVSCTRRPRGRHYYRVCLWQYD